MSEYCKYYKEKEQVSFDGGVTWVYTYNYRKGALYETESEDCGYYPPQYQWIVVSGGYECSGTTKMTQEKKQVSYDGGTTWQDVSPLETRAALPVIEYNSTSCGYIPPPPVGMKYKFTLEDWNIITGSCDSSSAITSADTRNYKGTMVEAEIGTCVTEIKEEAFSYASKLRSVLIPNNVLKICDSAFRNTGLRSVVIPDSISDDTTFTSNLGRFAFMNCGSLTSVTLSNNLMTIPMEAFYGCINLPNIRIPNGVKSINVGAFAGCVSLTSVTIPNSVEIIDAQAFAGCVSLPKIILPSVTTINHAAFYHCTSFTSIGLIGSGASVELPETLLTIWSEAFHSGTSITSITLPNSVTTIGENAFDYCEVLTTLTVGSGCTSIRDYAFFCCYNLTTVTCLAPTPPTLGTRVFDYTNLTTIYVPSESLDAYWYSEWGNLGATIQPIP